MSDVTGLTLLDRLRELHNAPKNRPEGGPMRYASVAQMAEYHAMHEAFPAVVALVEAAHLAVDSYPGTKERASDVDYYMEKLDAALAPFVGEAT